MNNRVVLITGASSGIGEATADAFASRGFRVFGTSRAPRAHAGAATRVTMLPLDVRDEAAARACVASVEREAGRLDVLVNNAGVMLCGPAEEIPLDAAHDLFDTNFWGVARMTNAALPLLRSQARGHIINVGSVAGTTAIPLNGFYAATKHALAGYTEALRYEVADLGVRVALVEPGDFKSRLWAGSNVVPPRIGAYGPLRDSVLRAMSAAIAAAPDPRPVAERIVQIAESEAPALHHRVGTWAHLLPRMKAWMPEAMFENGLRRRYLGREADRA